MGKLSCQWLRGDVVREIDVEGRVKPESRDRILLYSA